MYKLLLCVRYLRTRFIALASIISVMLGVATMIVVNSVMSGFGTEMRSRIHGILSDVVVETNSLDGVHDADRWMKIIRGAGGDEIESMAAMVEIYGMMTYDYRGQPVMKTVQLIGIDPLTKSAVSPDAGSFQSSLDSYQQIKEYGKVVREPLRSADEPVGWELTADAAESRRHRIELEQRYIEQRQWEEKRSQPESGTPDHTDLFEPINAKTAKETDKVSPPDFSHGEEPAVAVDPAAPQRAQLYVGGTGGVRLHRRRNRQDKGHAHQTPRRRRDDQHRLRRPPRTRSLPCHRRGHFQKRHERVRRQSRLLQSRRTATHPRHDRPADERRRGDVDPNQTEELRPRGCGRQKPASQSAAGPVLCPHLGAETRPAAGRRRD